MNNRAVSNTLGYVLLFGVVFMSLTLVGTLGVDSMENARDQTVQLNGERTMTGIGSALEDIHRENVTRRTSRVDLGRGSMSAGEPVNITISVDVNGDGNLDGPNDINRTYDNIQPLVYRVGDSRFIYEAGAVFLVRGDGARVVESPSMALDDGSGGNIIPVINTTAASDGSVSGSNAQILMSRSGGTTSVQTPGSSYHITIEIETTATRAALWEQVLRDVGASGCGYSSSTVSCSYSPDGGSVTIVHSTNIEYELWT